MFDKRRGTVTKAPIATVAQERGFYEDEAERELARRVETPANEVTEKLVAGLGLTTKERFDFAVYVATMLTRVPAHRVKAYSVLPSTLEEAKETVRTRITAREVALGSDASSIAEELADVDRIVSECHTSPPKAIVDYIRTPWPTDDMVQAVMAMTWRLLKPPKWEFFITSDNPAVFFEPYGLASPESELIFPLSPNPDFSPHYGKKPLFMA